MYDMVTKRRANFQSFEETKRKILSLEKRKNM